MKKIFVLLLFFSMALSAQMHRVNVTRLNLPFEKIDAEKVFHSEIKNGRKFANKISPVLFLAYDRFETAKRNNENFNDAFADLKKLIQLKIRNERELFIGILIKSAKPDVTKYDVEKYGGKCNTIVGNILTAEIPIDKIYKIAETRNVLYIDASVLREEKLDVSKGEVRADLVNNNLGLDGSGVVVGVLDSGIDWQHPVFGSNSGTRIKFLWDQSGNGNPPAGYSYGTEYTKTEIDNGQCNEVDGDDGHGHGTHVASTAAGFDYISNTFHGIAPAADVVFVKGFRNGPGFADNDVIDGCNYIFSKAQALGKPCVINLSLGGHFGAHDGTSLYEQALSGMTGNGKIIVAAAGNEGDSYIHAGYPATGGSINEAQQTLFVAHEGAQAIIIDIWYQTGNINFGLAAYDAYGNFVAATNPVAPGQSVNNQPFTDGSYVYAYYSIDATTTNDPNNNAKRVLIMLDSQNGNYNLRAVYWSLYSYGSGTFDAWIVNGGNFTTDDYPSSGIHAGDNNKSVGMPSTAQKIICVGSYMTKKCWTDINGNQRCYPEGEVGDISTFSSRGPSRDGRIKPDIAAPGQAIAAAKSGFLTNVDPVWILQGNRFLIMQGTSMATPHVTGVIALMLQADPQLNYGSALNHLTSTARSDSHTGTLPNNNFGRGKIDAYAAVRAVDVDDETENPLIFTLEQNYPNPFNPTTTIKYAIPSAIANVRLIVYNVLGEEVATLVNQQQAPGFYEVQFDASDLSSGIYFYTLQVGDFIATKKMVLMK